MSEQQPRQPTPIELFHHFLSPEMIAQQCNKPANALNQFGGLPPPREYREYDMQMAAAYKAMSNAPNMEIYEASSKAKESIRRMYEERGLDPNLAFSDAQSGMNGGQRAQLAHMCEAIARGIERNFQRYVSDQVVSPVDHEEKKRFVQQFFHDYGPLLGNRVDFSDPSRYAAQHDDVIALMKKFQKDVSNAFRGK